MAALLKTEDAVVAWVGSVERAYTCLSFKDGGRLVS